MVGRDSVAALTCGDGGLNEDGVVVGCNVAWSTAFAFGVVEKKLAMRLLVFWAGVFCDCFSFMTSKDGVAGELEVKGLMLRIGMAQKGSLLRDETM